MEHHGLDTPEVRARGHKGSDGVAWSRWGVTKAYTSPEVKRVVKERGIRLITYADLREAPPGR